jgi:Rieske Fe-S protein
MDEGIRDGVTLPGCENCVSRRTFLAEAGALAAVAAFFAACGDVGITDPTGTVVVTVSEFPGLATPNQLVLIDGSRAVKRTGATTFAAYSRACTHEGTRINLSGTGFVCPNHGARFDNNGNVTAGPANRALTKLATSYDAATDKLTIG